MHPALMICPYCHSPMYRTPGKPGNKHRVHIPATWICGNWPQCDTKCAEHPDGTLMSTPADAELRMLRCRVHDLCDLRFGNFYTKDPTKRREIRDAMYAWIKERCPTEHVGFMSKVEALEIIGLLEAELELKENGRC